MKHLLIGMFLEDLSISQIKNDKTQIDRKEQMYKDWKTNKLKQLNTAKKMINARSRQIMKGRNLSPDEKQRIIMNAEKQKSVTDERYGKDISSKKTDIDSDKTKLKQDIKNKRKQLTQSANNNTVSNQD